MSTAGQKEIRETNISAWRRTVCGDLTAAFQPFARRCAPRWPFPPRDSFFEQVHRAQFGCACRRDTGSLRRRTRRNLRPTGLRLSGCRSRSPGVRPSVALPYELAASGARQRGRKPVRDRARSRKRDLRKRRGRRSVSCLHAGEIPRPGESANACLCGGRRRPPDGFLGAARVRAGDLPPAGLRPQRFSAGVCWELRGSAIRIIAICQVISQPATSNFM